MGSIRIVMSDNVYEINQKTVTDTEVAFSTTSFYITSSILNHSVNVAAHRARMFMLICHECGCMSSDSHSPRLSVPTLGLQGLTQAQFGGAVALLVGGSQMLVGVAVLDGLLTVVVTWGGAVFATFGSNLIRNRPVLANDWGEDDEHEWVTMLIFTVGATGVLFATGQMLIG